jgi:response regulator of citrate/malate metabolism
MRNEIMSKVLIVEDEEAIADIEKDYLDLSFIALAISTSSASK